MHLHASTRTFVNRQLHDSAWLLTDSQSYFTHTAIPQWRNLFFSLPPPFSVPGTSFQSDKSGEGINGSKGCEAQASKKAGLQFPVGRIHCNLKSRVHSHQRMGATSAAYTAAILEYIANVLRMAGNSCKKSSNTKRITSRELELIMGQDEELHKLIKSLKEKSPQSRAQKADLQFPRVYPPEAEVAGALAPARGCHIRGVHGGALRLPYR